MLDHVVADHDVEGLGRETIGLDVAEDRLVGVGVVADLVFVDVDDGDVAAAEHIHGQEARGAATGLVDRKPALRQLAAQHLVNAEQAVAGFAGDEVEQGLGVRRGLSLGGCREIDRG